MRRFPAIADPCRTAADIPAGGCTSHVERGVALPATTITTAIILEPT